MGDKTEPDDFEQMLRRSRSIIYKVCHAYTDLQPDNILDLYQEIVCNLWRGWPQFRGECSPATWVYRVAVNTARLELRKRKKRPIFVPLDENMCESVAEETSDTHWEQLCSLIDQLPDKEKLLLRMRLDKLSHAEIAKITGNSETATKQHLYRIKRKLIQLYRRECE